VNQDTICTLIAIIPIKVYFNMMDPLGAMHHMDTNQYGAPDISH
jgi:hypothetical protein